MKKLNLLYTKWALDHRYIEGSYKETWFKLSKRRRILNKKFKFTKSAIDKFSKLNEELRLLDIKILDHLALLEKQKKLWLKNKVVDDYMIDVDIDFYHEGNYYEKINEKMYGNPILQMPMCIDSKQRSHYLKDWNELRDNSEHPLSGMKFCYSFYYLYFMTQLAYEDMLRIDTVWYNIEVYNQFTFNLRGKGNVNTD